jgi:hypothetical protein
MKNFILIIFFALFTFKSYSQGCGLVSGTKNKKSNIETKGGVVNSKDYYSLLIQKIIDPNDTIKYRFFLNATSKYMLSDSLLKSKGTFELQLTNGENIIIPDAVCENDPLGFGASVGFTVYTSEGIIKILILNPIQKLKVFGILETEFASRKQIQQQKIYNCLVN